MSQNSPPRRIQDRKGIRKEVLINTLNATQILQDDVDVNTTKKLEQLVQTTEVINLELSIEEKVSNQDEVVLDSEVMKYSSKVLEQCTNSLNKNITTYNANEYTELLLEYIHQSAELTEEDEGIAWHQLEDEIMLLFMKTPFFSTLSGALEPLPKKQIVRKERAPRKKDAACSQVKKPENVVTIEEGEESVEASVKKIRKIVKLYHEEHEKPLDYFQLVLHPTDFGRTIENILHVSFLVRDGAVSLTTDETGALYITPSTREMVSQAKKSGKRGNVQNIISLNPKQWKILRDYYDIQEPMINFRVGQKTQK